MRNVFLIFCFSFLSCQILAQRILSLDQAIAEGMKNNFQVLLAKNDSLGDAGVASAGSAGFLPVLSLNAGFSKASNNIRQEFSSGLLVERNGVGTDAYNSSLALNWTIFDGLKMFVTRDKMNEIRSLGELRVRQAMEETTQAIAEAYYEVLRESERKVMLQKILPLYEERYNISKIKNELGNGSRSDMLQAQADLIEKRSGLLRQEGVEEIAYQKLKQIMGIRVEETFVVDQRTSLDVEELQRIYQAALQRRANNSRLLFLQKQASISHLNLLELRSLSYPRLALNVNYNFTNVQNQAGFALLNRNLGLNAGLNFSWTIFNGFTQRRNIALAGIAENEARLMLRQEQQLHDFALGIAIIRLGRALAILSLEQDAVGFTAENVSLMTEKFRLGQCSSLELKEAQNSYVQTVFRSLDATYDSGVASAIVRRLAGKL